MKVGKVTVIAVLLVCAWTDALLTSPLKQAAQQKIVSPTSP